jgi:hypothetical protein
MTSLARPSALATLLVLALGPGCSAVISPDPGLLDHDANATGDGNTSSLDGARPDAGADAGVGPGVDTGVGPGDDAGIGDVDAFVGVDAFVPPVDAFVPPIDAFVRPDSGRDAGPMCMPGVECRGYDTTLAMAPTGSTSLGNCVIQMHRLDCCGAQAAYGVNHGARTTLCPAEQSCVMQYPPATCSDTSIVTDTGETTNNPNDVRLRIVDPAPCSFNPSATCYTCETFVCRSDTCRTAPGISGGCGP